MRNAIPLLIVFAMFFGSCAENQEKLRELEKRNNDLAQQLAARDRSIEDITSTMSEIHNKLESALAREKKVDPEAAAIAGTRSLTLAELKQRVLNQVGDITSTLSETRKKVTQLEQKMKAVASENTSLQKMVDDLKKRLEEREKSLADLQLRVQNLEAEVNQKARTIATHETTIESQKRQLNTVYYIIGKRNELKEKGIIAHEGGFLWGLLGATTVLSTNYDEEKFESLDKRRENVIDVPGKIHDMVPKRDKSSYSKEARENGHTILRIIKPELFWKGNHLAIIID